MASAGSGGRFRATPAGGRPPPARGPAPAVGPETAVALSVVGGVVGLFYVINAAITAAFAAAGAAMGAACAAAGAAMVAVLAMPVVALGACFEAMGNGILEGVMYMSCVCTSSSVGFVAGSGLFAAGSWLEQELFDAQQLRRRQQQQLQADAQQQEQRPGDEGAEQPREEEPREEGAAGRGSGGAGAAVTVAAAAAQGGPVAGEGVPAALKPLGRVGQWMASWEPDNVRAALPLASMGFGMLVMRVALSVMVHSSRAQRCA